MFVSTQGIANICPSLATQAFKLILCCPALRLGLSADIERGRKRYRVWELNCPVYMGSSSKNKTILVEHQELSLAFPVFPT